MKSAKSSSILNIIKQYEIATPINMSTQIWDLPDSCISHDTCKKPFDKLRSAILTAIKENFNDQINIILDGETCIVVGIGVTNRLTETIVYDNYIINGHNLTLK